MRKMMIRCNCHNCGAFVWIEEDGISRCSKCDLTHIDTRNLSNKDVIECWQKGMGIHKEKK